MLSYWFGLYERKSVEGEPKSKYASASSKESMKSPSKSRSVNKAVRKDGKPSSNVRLTKEVKVHTEFPPQVEPRPTHLKAVKKITSKKNFNEMGQKKASKNLECTSWTDYHIASEEDRTLAFIPLTNKIISPEVQLEDPEYVTMMRREPSKYALNSDSTTAEVGLADDEDSTQGEIIEPTVRFAMKLMKAKFAFQARNNDELSFEKGDVITITQQVEGGWWEGTLNGKTGWFPSNYAIECKTEDRAANAANAVLVDQPTREQHHQLVITHLVESEKEYVDLLTDLNSRYLQPLSKASVLNKPELSTLCSNVEQMCSFQQALLHSLTESAKQAVSLQRIGGLFLTNAALFQNIYETYSLNHPDTVTILNKYRSQLDAYMEGAGAASPGAKSLTNSLAAPLVRLDKYPALLKELEIHIDEAHVDRGDTQRALGVMRDLQVVCLDARKEREMQLDIENSEISGWEGEELVSLGPVRLSAHVRLHVESMEPSDRIALLLDDSIILLSVNQSLHYHYQGKLMLTGLKVKVLEDDESRSNALELSGTMIDIMVICFPSQSKRAKWYKLITATKDKAEDRSPNMVETTPKPVKSNTLPPQVTSKASIKTLTNSAKTAEVLQSSQVIESYDRLAQSNRANGLKPTGPWSMSCLRPIPPSRPIFMSPEDSRSPKLQRKSSTLGRRKNNVDDTKVLQEDAKILKIIEAYCTSVRSRHTVNSSASRIPTSMTRSCPDNQVEDNSENIEPIYESFSILDNPNMLIAEDEKIICEVLRDNETVIEEKTLVDTVYVIKDQLKELQQDYHKLRREFEDERKVRKKLESVVQRHIGGISRIPKSPLVSSNNTVRTTPKPTTNHSQSVDENKFTKQAEET